MELFASTSWVSSWARNHFRAAGLDESSAVHVMYDAWPQESAVIIENQRSQLPATFQLSAHALKAVTVRPHLPMKLTCVAGVIWVTKDRDATDYVVVAGDEMELTPGQPVVALAFNFGVLRVDSSGQS